MIRKPEIRNCDFVVARDIEANLVLCEVPPRASDGVQVCPIACLSLHLGRNGVGFYREVYLNPLIGFYFKRRFTEIGGVPVANLTNDGVFPSRMNNTKFELSA